MNMRFRSVAWRQVYTILDEFFLSGEVQETSKAVIMARCAHAHGLSRAQPLQHVCGRRAQERAGPGYNGRVCTRARMQHAARAASPRRPRAT